ncbi:MULTISPECIES: discoidin domain-containing protein [unclassified Crossiella]|uniref:discoidin domain-containing protein n=1 Tax=unclassified Crossiella TaxID=2620835 RepID=UPI001FFF381B|nr:MULTISPECIES: discoidin domain-containing protein [unclassified Crossiella]MCK2241742.1 discoidin domain-containing protein [Crossiella sp. S99.2]MCK2255386.1 discoidin domain-containing protein [Crossiella sp. S99.1]
MSPASALRLRRIAVLAAALGLAPLLSPIAAPAASAAACGTENLALHRPATSSSTENGGTQPAAAVDGDAGTRWSSAFSDPQWLQLDLGGPKQLCRVTLNWETAHAKAFQVQVSDDAATWRSVHTATDSAGGLQQLDVAGTGRYLRVHGTQRATGYGYSLWEVGAYAVTDGSDPVLPPTDPRNPDFGPNVLVVDPRSSTVDTQNRLNAIAREQRTNQFGPQRHAVLFKPGNYNADVDLRFYTQVAGLGLHPDDVNINGHVRVEADWLQQGEDPNNLGNATQNFWRSAENMSVTLPPNTIERWAVAQAAPYRRMHVRGQLHLWNGHDGWASGGWISDSKIDGVVVSGSQQQFMTRNTQLVDGWAGSVWNMVFVGSTGTPPPNFPNPSHTVLPTTPVIREKPFLHVNAAGDYGVFVPSLRHNASGTSWASGSTAGSSISLSQFYLVKPGTPAATINAALNQGRHLLFTPGVHRIDDTIRVTRPDTVVLGLGLATVIPTTGKAAISVSDVDGVKLAGLLVDAGPVNSPVLVELGEPGSSRDHAANPVSVHDLFLRVGGAGPGKATVSLRVNSHDTIIDHVWAWRGDHGDGVGWTVNTGANGVVVNGADVTAYGLFAEHYQQHNVLWNGENGRTYMFQNELPYDPPDQASWMNGGTQGWAAYKVADSVNRHEGWGLGSYCYNNVNPSVVTANSFEVPRKPGVRMHNLAAVSLGGVGTISNIINGVGGPANTTTQVRYLTEYP